MLKAGEKATGRRDGREREGEMEGNGGRMGRLGYGREREDGMEERKIKVWKGKGREIRGREG